jgi:hypothetical protein
LSPTDSANGYVHGDWALSFTLIRTPGVTLSPPAAGELAGKPVTFSDLHVNRGTVSMVVTISNSTVKELGRFVPDSSKGHDALNVALHRGSDSATVLSMGMAPEGQTVVISALWLVSPGTYNLELSYDARGSLVRQIDVPIATGPGQR